MALKRAIKSFWMHYYNLGGRTSRSDYWWAMLGHVIIFVVWLAVFLSVLGTNDSLESLRITSVSTMWLAINNWTQTSSDMMLVVDIGLVVVAFLLLPTIAIHIRRLRDVGIHPLLAWNIWILSVIWVMPLNSAVITGISLSALLLSIGLTSLPTSSVMRLLRMNED